MDWGVGPRRPAARARWLALGVALAAVATGVYMGSRGMRLEGSVVALAGVLPYILLTLQWLVSYVRQPQAAPPLPRTPAPPSEEVIAASQDTPVIVANDPLPRHDQVYGE